jgi:DNA-binding protein HU-beta
LRFRFVPGSIPQCPADAVEAFTNLMLQCAAGRREAYLVAYLRKHAFHRAANHISYGRAFSRLRGGQSIMAVSRPGKAKAPTAAAKAGPVTLKHLAARLAKDHQLTKRAGEAILGDLVSLITKHLKKGERVRISGFGILQVRARAARMGRNPATGEAIKIKASKKVAFRPAKDLKLAI